ncbi:unnamed protein product [Mycena citricolor]|uniref:Uncharacterized protein n=1 Tax=Mycena citricolor TaxID=2018698 RepID=A0AAD2HEH6_9AGAR|nr:unnamed protein product [Mycena citricolor]
MPLNLPPLKHKSPDMMQTNAPRAHPGQWDRWELPDFRSRRCWRQKGLVATGSLIRSNVRKRRRDCLMGREHIFRKRIDRQRNQHYRRGLTVVPELQEHI